MAQFDIHTNPDPGSAKVIPYVIEVQSDLLDELPTVVVLPLADPSTIEQLPILRLNPRVTVEEQPLVVLAQDMAAVPRRLLSKPIGNLSAQRNDILAALDFLFTGF
ncbi:MAG: CcdB family protein [Parasulfuritortus sp.]|nr:CcdB family protein [Parasulfuritortus sp.]